jgi:hypothetical protein
MRNIIAVGILHELEKSKRKIKPTRKRLLATVEEFHTHITNNQTFIVESTVNYVVAKRFTKRQQMQWSPKAAHLL